MTAFEKKCKAVADDIGIEVTFYPDNDRANAYEDDGALHVVRCGQRACFGVGIADDPVEQTKNTRLVLTALKLEKEIGDHTLVYEWGDS